MLCWAEYVGLIAVLRISLFRVKDMGWDLRGSKIDTRWPLEINVYIVKLILEGSRS